MPAAFLQPSIRLYHSILYLFLMKAIKAVRLLVYGQIADPYLKWEWSFWTACRKASLFSSASFLWGNDTPASCQPYHLHSHRWREGRGEEGRHYSRPLQQAAPQASGQVGAGQDRLRRLCERKGENWIPKIQENLILYHFFSFTREFWAPAATTSYLDVIKVRYCMLRVREEGDWTNKVSCWCSSKRSDFCLLNTRIDPEWLQWRSPDFKGEHANRIWLNSFISVPQNPQIH